jgi:hypothetical protein
MYAILLAFVLVWCGFLALLTWAHYGQIVTSYGIQYRVTWFDPLDGVLVTLPFLLPGLALLMAVFVFEMQERYRRQSWALLRTLRLRDEALTPAKDITWPTSTVTEHTRFTGITMAGWGTANRIYLLMRLGARLLLFVQLSVSQLAQAPSRYNRDVLLPVDIIAQVVFILVIIIVLIVEVRLVFRPNVAMVDEQGVTLPSPTASRAQVHIAWGEIRALYQVRTHDAYWLLVTDTAIYGWSQTPFSRGLGGTELAHTIASRLHLPVRDANNLCLAAVGATTTPEMQQRWQALLAQTPPPPDRRALRFDLRASFVLLAIGLGLGIAASWVMSQFA